MRSRKGLSTVVGMVFALIALAISVGYITYSMNILDQYNQVVIAKSQQTIDNGKENFQLYTSTIKNNKFNVTVINTGNLPINITRMWVQNYSVSDSVNYYTINTLVSPGATMINIGQNIPLTVNPASNGYYNIKLITTRGNSLQFNMGSPGVKPLFMQLMFFPNKSSVTGLNVTLLYLVTNNSTSNNLLTNIQPQLSSPTCTGTGSLTSLVGPVPAQYPALPSGGTAIFKWNYVFGGSAGNKCYITASLKNGIASNFAYDTISLP